MTIHDPETVVGDDVESTQPAGVAGTSLAVALLEDDDTDARLFGRLLDRAWAGSVDVGRFARVEELECAMADLSPDIVFCDLSVPDGVGIEVVDRAVRCSGDAPVVVLTGNSDPTLSVRALERGAKDYLVKGSVDVELLARTLRYSIARAVADGQIRRAVAELLQLDEERDQYAGIVAHDLRAPVRTARLTADRMIAAVTKGTDPGPMAAALDSSLERIEATIDHLLKMATLRDDAVELVEQPLSRILDDVRADLSADLTETGGVLVCTEDGIIRGDHVLVRELLRNLVQNSIKYRSTERDIEITVSTARSSDGAEILVSDNGIGIEPQYRSRVFRLFERLQADDAPGLGFGLAFCRRVADLHHGTIEICDPIAPLGTTVRIVFPSGH